MGDVARIAVNGCEIECEILGAGPPVVITAGGRSGRDVMRGVAEQLAPRYRVVIYDRRNCGASDVIIAGEDSEQGIWAEDLAQLILALDLAPAHIGGWSAGCRVSLLLAIRYPELVRSLLLGWVTGGKVAAERLAEQYYGQFIRAAQTGGMNAVIETPFFAERVAQNPSNRARLLSMDPRDFIRTMTRWSAFFTEGADQPVLGATAKELAQIKVPTVIASGDDELHTPIAAVALHLLIPRSELHAPVIPRAEWDELMKGPEEERYRIRAERAGPILLRFLDTLEPGPAKRS